MKKKRLSILVYLVAKNAPLDLINAHQNASAAKQQVNLSSRKLSSNCAC